LPFAVGAVDRLTISVNSVNVGIMTSTFTLRTHDFQRAFKTAAEFAGTYAINGVCLDVCDDGTVTFAATDTHRLGVVRVETAEHTQGENTRAFIALSDVKTLVSQLKVPARDADYDRITVTIGEMFEWKRSSLVGVSTGSVQNLTEIEFPRLHRLLRDALYVDPITDTDKADRARFAASPAYLASFAKAAWDKGDIVLVEPGVSPRKPIVIRVGAHFLGLLMPIGIRDTAVSGNTADDREAWRALIDVT